MELCDMSAVDLAAMLRKGEISSREITESVFKRIDERDKTLNAYITTVMDMALRQADLADEGFRRNKNMPLLSGIPIAVKDIICTKGIRTTCASRILDGFIPAYNATVVDRIINDGAVITGKTNMDEFGMGSSTENSIIGPTLNPFDTRLVAGGSSGGSATAVAAGEAILALGTDTGGSIRQPSAFCGTAGLKPTYGRVSRYGVIAYASSLDQVGPIGRTVEDCAMLLDAIAGHDSLDSTSAEVHKPDFLKSLKKDIKGLRAGLPKEYFIEGLNKGIKESINESVKQFEKNGIDAVEISLPHTKYAVAAYYLIATAEASSNLARYDGVKYGFRTADNIDDIIEMYEATRSQGFGKEVKRRIMLGTYVLSAGYYDAYYLKAQKIRRMIKNDFDNAFKHVDFIITPTTPDLPFKLGEKLSDPLQMYLEDIYTIPLNLSGLPGLNVRCGDINGLPVGMQIIGKAFDEETVLRVGHGYEIITAQGAGRRAQG
ncbi:MAG: Asp-tRNA(Asn)/Glu-tRNA(Gln) amidotransferase subunit GatA [Deltaproteobacteria bacterium]|nr:Asp-tRNA(Asn)/Glu-tRNA(Gln) amidotransferase subunit GatA [Deltaproteobacteria bacterium]